MNSNRFRRHLRSFQAMVSALVITIVCGAVGQSFPPAAQAETISAPGFTAEVVTTLPPFLPVGVTWASDGRMFIWQRNGVIRIYKNGQLLATPFLDISANVNLFNDRGLLGLALHPNFLVNGYVYVIYVREEGGDPNDASPKIACLSRFTANPQNPDVALATSETILLTIPNDFHHHANGTLRFGPDGKLFVGHGDDANLGGNVLAFVAQDLNDLRGKILRINEDGTAPGDNPFDDGTNSIKSKVYSYGLRNPFRFTLHPVSGEPYIGDVGWNDWEEFDRGRGKNFGWPCYEGVNPQPTFQTTFPSQCASLTPSVVTAPLLSYPLPGTPPAVGAPIVGSSAIGGPFYTATLYPELYRGNWFITDYVAGWILRMVFDGAGNLTNTVPFATGLSGPVDMELGPDGMLYYVSIVTGQVKRIRYNGPSAVASATPSSGLSPLPVNFASAGSSDPNSSPLTYLWDFGDGQTSTAADPFHAYASATVQTFTATLTVTNNTSQSSTATVKVTVGSLPPTATIQAPINRTNVTPGQTIAYQGSATDPEDGAIPSAGLSWIILLHHNDHTHTQLFTTGPTGSVVIQDHGIGTYSYEFQLTATDSSGLTHTTSVTLPVQGDTTSPNAPSSLVATAVSASQINLSWAAATDNVGVTGYRMERCQGVGCTSFVQIATPVTTSYNDIGLTATTTYNYRVRASDAANNLSGYSNIAAATTPAPDTTPPSDVTGVTATAVSPTQINLSWPAATDNVGVTGYRVERCTGAGCTAFVQIATPTTTSYSDTGLAAATSYSYRVKAVDVATNVSVNYSTVVSAVTQAPPPDTIPPTDPTGLTATAASSSQINLAWTASTDSGGSGLAGYRVERCQGAGCTTFVQIATTSTNSYSDPNLTAGIRYRYRVRAVDGAGNLSLNNSNTASATPPTNLVTAYGMNEGSGTTLADASGRGHTGTLVNGPAWFVGQATYGQALSFDGLDDAVSVANPATYNFGTANFTLETWVKRSALGGTQRHLFSKCAAATWALGCKKLYFNLNNRLSFGSFATGNTLSSTIADTNWHHVAVTFTDSTNTLRIYVDGALATTATKALEADGAGHVVTVGNLRGSSNPFSGLLDEVRIYSRVLTLAEIQADRTTPIVP